MMQETSAGVGKFYTLTAALIKEYELLHADKTKLQAQIGASGSAGIAMPSVSSEGLENEGLENPDEEFRVDDEDSHRPEPPGAARHTSKEALPTSIGQRYARTSVNVARVAAMAGEAFLDGSVTGSTDKGRLLLLEDEGPGAGVQESSSEGSIGWPSNAVGRWGQLAMALLSAGGSQVNHLYDCWRPPDGMSSSQIAHEDPIADQWLAGRNIRSSRRGPIVHSPSLQRFHWSPRQVHRISTVHPHGTLRACWSFFGVAIVIFDIFTLTLELFDPGELFFVVVVDWLSVIFFTADLFFSSTTGYFEGPVLIMDFKLTAWKYFTTWAALDLFTVLCQWTILCLESTMSQVTEAAKILNILKLAKVLKIMRLAKCATLMRTTFERVNSVSVELIIKIVGQLMFLIAAMHVIACCWYGIGKGAHDEGWVDILGLSDAELAMKYLVAAHWALAQLQGSVDVSPGRSIAERGYAVAATLLSIVLLAMFQSRLTQHIIELQRIRDHKMQFVNAVTAYLGRNNISQTLSGSVKKYAEWSSAAKRRGLELGSDEVLRILPQELRTKLLLEIRGGAVAHHIVFAFLMDHHSDFFQRLCTRLLEPLSCEPEVDVYQCGDQCSEMHFLLSGECSYVHWNDALERIRLELHGEQVRGDAGQVPGQRPRIRATEIRELKKAGHELITAKAGHHLCEGVLWMQWWHRGYLQTDTHANFLRLSGQSFAEHAEHNARVQRHLTLHAQNFMHAVKTAARVSDFFDSTSALQNS